MTLVSEPVAAAGAGAPPVLRHAPERLRLAVESEWIKLRSVRSTVLATFIMVVGVVAIGALVCAAHAARWDHLSVDERLRLDPTNRSLNGRSTSR